jgi:tRNA (adenine37-N6)-methyltransferase
MQDDSIRLRPIAHVVNGIHQLGGIRWEEVESRIVVDEPFTAGLEGLDGFSHVIVISYLHRRDRPVPSGLHVRPEGRPDMPLLGVFATRTPKRPNPLAISAVRLIRLEGNELVVSGLDVIDGTPVLDLKPYLRNGDLVPDATAPEWILRMWNRAREGQGSMGIREFKLEDIPQIVEILKENQQYGHPDVDGPDAMRRVAACEAAEFLVAEQAGRVVGMIHGVFDGSRAVIYIASVLPAWQRKGLGRDLVRAIAQRFKDRGAVSLSAVIPGEPAFWSKLGFRQTTRVMTAYPIDAALENGE